MHFAICAEDNSSDSASGLFNVDIGDAHYKFNDDIKV